MKMFEQALIDSCIKTCTINLAKTIKVFKSVNRTDEKAIEKDVEKIIYKYLKETNK